MPRGRRGRHRAEPDEVQKEPILDEIESAEAEENTGLNAPVEESTFRAAVGLIYGFRVALKYAWIIALILATYWVVISGITMGYLEFEFVITEDIGLKLGFSSNGACEHIPEQPDYPYSNHKGKP